MTALPPDTASTAAKTWTREGEKRNAWAAVRRGFFCRCPRCGEGKLFRSFLKTADKCSECGLDFTPHRADDLPAYLVIVVVGHIVVPLALMIEKEFAPPLVVQWAIYLPVTLLMALWLIQPIKGGVVGLQWALRMHGFDENFVDDHV
ncbi:hypothetical protein NB311A_17189 [Nitrobacter sp. Nb-311A]|uniref:DUF983 domain-containing protein n=1 Tax=unclassified Nitrobacter TaxID=2620411 RepID=UPI0000687387|nr:MULTISPECIES: DUF983 domain-containing protein [unclassified Nitrobacter]EAQ35532.1 hypothetical protein NB311A_17189 [Nitrobacter sp. Nb-311A]MCB1392609.1 DUF983 domain-containing protein [Nitrobacter sp.]MCV0385941.1 DUF983 domain-containing protein [Nitrobacter sp.]